MVDFILVVGLIFSGALTVSLFIDIYGVTVWGVFLGVGALALFELGLWAWKKALVEKARGLQIPIAAVGAFVCALLSVASSGLQLVRSTDLWQPAFDEDGAALLAVVLALAFNIFLGLAWWLADPSRRDSVADAELESADTAADRKLIAHGRSLTRRKKKARFDETVDSDAEQKALAEVEVLRRKLAEVSKPGIRRVVDYEDGNEDYSASVGPKANEKQV